MSNSDSSWARVMLYGGVGRALLGNIRRGVHTPSQAIKSISASTQLNPRTGSLLITDWCFINGNRPPPPFLQPYE